MILSQGPSRPLDFIHLANFCMDILTYHQGQEACQICWKFLSATTDGATSFRKRSRMSRMCNFLAHWWCSRHSLRSSEEATSPSICRDRDERSCIDPQSLPLLFPLFILLQLHQDSSIELDLSSLAQLQVALHRQLQGVCEGFHRWP